MLREHDKSILEAGVKIFSTSYSNVDTPLRGLLRNNTKPLVNWRDGTRREGIGEAIGRSAVASPMEGDKTAISGPPEIDLLTIPMPME